MAIWPICLGVAKFKITNNLLRVNTYRVIYDAKIDDVIYLLRAG